MYRCANDYFGYCSGEPDWGKRPTALKLARYGRDLDTGSVAFGTCKLDLKTCGKHHTLAQMLEQFKVEHPSHIPASLATN